MSGAGRHVTTSGVAILLTCEHGGNRIPAPYRDLFRDAGPALASHRGWDAGALPLARSLASALGAPLRAATVSRLLVDLNRSAHHPRVFSEWTRGLSPEARAELLARFHAPHREAVDADVARLVAAGRTVLHLGVHTFTPVLDGEVRTADVALLYDPAHGDERRLGAAWAAALAPTWPDLAVRRNQPYRGASDGLTTWLRGRHGSAYLGFEIEVNQRLLGTSGRFPARIAHGVVAALTQVSG